MLRHDESSIRRHPDGSLDISFYGSRALWLRKAARTDALKRIATIVKANLTPIGSRMGARIETPHPAR